MPFRVNRGTPGKRTKRYRRFQSARRAVFRKYRPRSDAVSTYSQTRSSSTLRSLGSAGFPKKLMIRHKLTTPYYFDAVDALGEWLMVIANGMYQPITTSSGTGYSGVPQFYNSLNEIYDHWTVLASKITWTISTDTSNVIPLLVAASIDDNGTIGTLSTMMEQADSQAYTYTPVGAPLVIQQRFHNRSWFGKSPLSDSDQKGSASTNPSEKTYFAIKMQPIHSVTLEIKLSVMIQMEYTAIWNELKDIQVQ